MPWPAYPPDRYLGQLDPGFQQQMAANRAHLTREDCDFYHAAALPDGDVIPGAWDLRGRETEYLGSTDVSGLRVLELGPATGHMTFFMERAGAEVVALDVGWDKCVDLLPRPGIELSWARMDIMRYIGATQNSWWYLHREYGSSARAVYGSVYDIPADLGTFDCGFFGAILLHLRDPFAALSSAADHVADTIVVTDCVQEPELDQAKNLMRFAPLDTRYPTHWWSMTAGAVVRMLERLGFTETQVTFHTQLHHIDHDLTKPPQEVTMFTVVARRP
ncbi:MAG: class I SAM-dependent methyltransferase [Acidimicrobiales bacterium]